MKVTKTEIEARYRVVELLYQGNIDEAEQALNLLCQDRKISPKNELRYRLLLAQARLHEETAALSGER